MSSVVLYRTRLVALPPKTQEPKQCKMTYWLAMGRFLKWPYKTDQEFLFYKMASPFGKFLELVCFGAEVYELPWHSMK